MLSLHDAWAHVAGSDAVHDGLVALWLLLKTLYIVQASAAPCRDSLSSLHARSYPTLVSKT